MTDPQLPPPYQAVPPAPGYAAPPGAYRVPVGGYAEPSGTYGVPQASAPASRTLGTLSLVLGLLAAVVAPIIVAFPVYEIGRRVPEALVRLSGDTSATALALLSPARDQVLWAELTFWSATVVGIAAVVLGILAIARRRGRGQGIGALVAAVLGPAIFLVVAGIALAAGTATGGVGLYS